MSETQAPAPQGPSAGMLLRQAREAAGLHPEALAVALKVPVHQIEGLEEDRLDVLPDTVFARALAASLCRHLRIDPQPVLARMPQGKPMSRLGDREPINAPFRRPGDSVLAVWRDRLGRPAVMTALVLLLGALILLVLPLVQNQIAKLSEPAAGPAGAETSQSAIPAAAPGVVIESVQPQGVPEAPATPPAPAAQVPTPAVPASVPAPGAMAAPAVQPVVAEAASAPASAPASSSLVSLRTRAASWVQVTDARGAMPVRRLVNAGETVSVGGVPPLSVTVGSASATEVSVRGRPFDLAPFTRDNVARFEVQ